MGPGQSLGQGSRGPLKTPGFKLFWKTHNPFPNSSKAFYKLQITVLKNWFGCQNIKENHVDDLKTMEEDCETFSKRTCKSFEKGA